MEFGYPQEAQSRYGVKRRVSCVALALGGPEAFRKTLGPQGCSASAGDDRGVIAASFEG
jgi:hypothetical protein